VAELYGFDPATVPTTGGYTTIIADNIGTNAALLSVYVVDMFNTTTFYPSQVSIQVPFFNISCQMPAGDGAGYSLYASVNGELAAHPIPFAYSGIFPIPPFPPYPPN
jgi:hypothetical protein